VKEEGGRGLIRPSESHFRNAPNGETPEGTPNETHKMTPVGKDPIGDKTGGEPRTVPEGTETDELREEGKHHRGRTQVAVSHE